MIDPIAVLGGVLRDEESFIRAKVLAPMAGADLCDWNLGGKKNRRLRELAISTLEIAYLAGGYLRALPLAGNYKILCSKNNRKEKREPWRRRIRGDRLY